MYQVKFTAAYKKSYKLMKKRGFDLSLLDNVLIFCDGDRSSTKNIAITDCQATLRDFGNAISSPIGC